MEDQVVNKIERKLQETPHLDFVRSYTRPGSAIITLQVKGDTNATQVADAFYQVRKKVGDIANELPRGLLGPYFNDEFGDTFVTLHSLSGEGYSYPELKTFAIQARDMLLTTPGVEKAVIIGDQPEKIYIDISSAVLASRGLTLTDVQNAIKGQNNVDPAGSVDTGTRSVRISVEGGVTKPADIASCGCAPATRSPVSAISPPSPQVWRIPTSASIASTARIASRSAWSWRRATR